MANAYTSPEGMRARMRAVGQKLTLWGAIFAGLGVAGIIVSMVLKAVFLGVLGGPIASLSWLAFLVGSGLLLMGFNKIREARGA